MTLKILIKLVKQKVNISKEKLLKHLASCRICLKGGDSRKFKVMLNLST